MQRCCSGSGRRAHTPAPSPPPPPGLPPPRPDSSQRLREQGRRGGRPRGLAAGLALTHRLGQRPPAPANTPLSPQVGGNQFCLLSLPLPGEGDSPGVLLWAGTRSSVPLQLRRGRGRAGTSASGWSQSDFSPLGLEVPSALSTWVASCRAQQAPPGQEAGLLQCVQEFKPVTGRWLTAANAFRGGSGSGPCPGPQSRTRKSRRPGPRPWPAPRSLGWNGTDCLAWRPPGLPLQGDLFAKSCFSSTEEGVDHKFEQRPVQEQGLREEKLRQVRSQRVRIEPTGAEIYFSSLPPPQLYLPPNPSLSSSLVGEKDLHEVGKKRGWGWKGEGHGFGVQEKRATLLPNTMGLT